MMDKDSNCSTNVSVWETQHDSVHLRELSVRLLSEIRSGNDSVDSLCVLFTSNRSEVRQAAAWVASELGFLATPLLPTLIDLLGDSDPTVRLSIASTILGLGYPAIESAFPALLVLLYDDEPEIRHVAFRTLLFSDDDMLSRQLNSRGFGNQELAGFLRLGIEPDRERASRLRVGLDGDCTAIQLVSLAVALRVGREASSVVDNALRHPDAQIRELAAIWSHKTGDSLIPSLIDVICNDKEETVRASALCSLGKTPGFGDDRHREIVTHQLFDTSAYVGCSALYAMSRLVPLRPHESDAVFHCVRHQNESVVYLAVDTLWSDAESKSEKERQQIATRLFSVATDGSIDSTRRSYLIDTISRCPETMIASLSRCTDVLNGLLEEVDEQLILATFDLLLCCGITSPLLLTTSMRLSSSGKSQRVRRMAGEYVNTVGIKRK